MQVRPFVRSVLKSIGWVLSVLDHLECCWLIDLHDRRDKGKNIISLDREVNNAGFLLCQAMSEWLCALLIIMRKRE